ncbi:MAG TPA: hypothetical protein PKD05_06735 [Candidatus Melainabacteria bacterium]|nr:hypothetical protein [Candidatus Melainabacteria bacterium]HMP51236.1 hypothetical protein [Candidatus Melainabacteria bacterium]
MPKKDEIARYSERTHPGYSDLGADSPFVYNAIAVFCMGFALLIWNGATFVELSTRIPLCLGLIGLGAIFLLVGKKPDKVRLHNSRATKIVSDVQPIKMKIARVEVEEYKIHQPSALQSPMAKRYKISFEAVPGPNETEPKSDQKIDQKTLQITEPNSYAILDVGGLGKDFSADFVGRYAFVYRDPVRQDIVAFEALNTVYWTRPDDNDFLHSKI